MTALSENKILCRVNFIFVTIKTIKQNALSFLIAWFNTFFPDVMCLILIFRFCIVCYCVKYFI